MSEKDVGDSDESDVEYIYRAYTHTRDGKLIFARQYGKKAFRIPVPRNRNRQSDESTNPGEGKNK